MTKITRTKTMATGGITDQEKLDLKKHADLWISRALRTDPIQPDKIGPAIRGIYAAAGLDEPVVVIAPSPMVMAFAFGAASAILKDNATHDATLNATDSASYVATVSATDNATLGATRNATRNATRSATDSETRNATDSATRNATENATLNATYGATYDATHDATLNATVSATRSATYDATDNAIVSATRNATRSATRSATDSETRNATYDATDSATRNATHDATRSATHDATRSATRRAIGGAAEACFDLAGEAGLNMAKEWWRAHQGGNMWASGDCFLTGMRDVIGLDLPEYETYGPWEQAAIHGGFRVMHEKFCIVSDFPEFIHMDENNQPHCETGPSHRWRDGWSLYHWHGISVPAHWIEATDTVDPAEVLRCENVEERAAGCAILGWPRMAEQLNRRIIDGDPNSDIGALIELTLPGLPDPGRFLQAVCPRNGTICEGVPKVSDIDDLPIETVIAAQAWRDCLPASEYEHPSIRT